MLVCMLNVNGLMSHCTTTTTLNPDEVGEVRCRRTVTHLSKSNLIVLRKTPTKISSMCICV